jgi:hypothetical protein
MFKPTGPIKRKNNYLAGELRKSFSILVLIFPLGLFAQTENFENTVWMLGKPDPDQPCQIITNCECCLSQMLFMEDGICITINPCFEGGETYTKGKYKIQNNELTIESENWLLVKKTIWNPKVDLAGDPGIEIKRRTKQQSKKYFGIVSCQGSPFLRKLRGPNSMSGKKQKLPTAFQFFQLLKKEGLWEILMEEK